MPTFAIAWDLGDGSFDTEVIEAESLEKAQDCAYDAWRQAAEDRAEYSATPCGPLVDNVEYSDGEFSFYNADGDELTADRQADEPEGEKE
jgi:hypothetical protein